MTKGKPLRVANVACTSCPYRRDTPSGLWSPEEYVKLKLYDTGYLVPLKFPGVGECMTEMPVLAVFKCHQSGTTGVPTACRGWLSVHRDHPSVRLAERVGAIKPEDVPTEDESDVYYASGTEACEAGMRDVAKPSPKALRMVARLVTKGVGRFVKRKRRR